MNGNKWRSFHLLVCSAMVLIAVSASFTDAEEKRIHQLGKLDGLLQQHMREIDGSETTPVVVKLVSIGLRDIQCETSVGVLKAQASRSQRSLLEFLKDEREAEILNSFWLVNALLVNVTADTLHKLVDLDIVDKVFENFEISVPEPSNQLNRSAQESNVALESVNVTWGLDRVDVPGAWAVGYNGSGIRVCVLDTGVDMSHPDLQAKMWTDDPVDPTFPGGWIEFDWTGNVLMGSTPYDTAGHGTHTSGTVLGGNQSGVAVGVAPGAWLMHGLILPGGSGTFAQCIAGMQWAIDPFDQYGNSAGEKASVVSMSWGADGYHDEMIEPINNMRAAGVIPIASIGNVGEGSSGSPGNVYGSLGIGAVDVYDSVAWFSSGEVVDWPASYSDPYIKPDFSAPGVNVYSAVPSSGWEYWSGTSMAAPHVAGTIALMLQANHNMTVDDVYEILRIIADDLGDSGRDTRYGWGVVNACQAVSLAILNCGVEGYVKDVDTSQPLEWAAQVNVLDVSWGRTNTSEDGFYRIWLYPNNYSVTVEAFGYSMENTTVEIVEDRWSRVNFTLTAMPRGVIFGVVTDFETNTTIGNATVHLRGTPLPPAVSNSTGYYSFEAPVGVYTADFWAWGYRPALISNVRVLENQTTIVNVQLNLTIKVAVLGDFRSQVVNLLMRNISAHQRDWDVIQEVSNYDVIIVNTPSDPGEQTFLNLITAADEHAVGLVFTNTYPGPWSPYGITLLQQYLDDPEGSYHAFWSGSVYYEVAVNHPIFDGWNVGDKIVLVEGGDEDFAWFYRYSGVTIADVGSYSLGPLGGGVAYTVRSLGNVHMLLSGLSQNSYTNIKNAWTEDAKRIFKAAVTWASEPVELLPPVISVTPNTGLVGSKVTINGSGFTINSDVTVKFDDTPIATSKTDSNGSFVAIFNTPIAEGGVHMIKATDGYGHRAETLYTVKAGSVESKSLEVKVDVGTVYLTGEVAEFHVLTSLNGVPVDVNNLNAEIYKPDRTSEVLASNLQDTGVYLITFDVPANAPNGTYTLKVEAGLNGVNGSSIGSFLVSPTLATMNAALVTIEDDLAVVKTDVGMIKMNFTDVNARIDTIEGDVAVIKTDLGELKADIVYVTSIIEDLNSSLIEIEDGIARLETEIGELMVNLTSTNADIALVREEVAIVKTDVGEIKVNVAYARSVIESNNNTLVKIQGDVATVRTDIGEIKGVINEIQGDVATLETELGEIKVRLPVYGEDSSLPNASLTQLAVLMFSGGIVIAVLMLLWRHIANSPNLPVP